MLNLLTFIFASAVLSLLIIFFVLFLISTASMKRKMTGANETIENLQQALQAAQIENKNALARLEAETQRINAGTASVIKQKHEEYCVKLKETQDWAMQGFKKHQDDTAIAMKSMQTSLHEALKQMYAVFQSDSVTLKNALNSRLNTILNEIKAPLV